MLKKFTPQIYVSGINEVDDVVKLNELGITAILNVANDVNDPMYLTEAFECVKVGLKDNSNNSQAMKALAVIALRSLIDEGHIVLVHCMAGASRSPYIVIRYLAEKEQRAIEAIYAEFRAQFGEGEILMSPLNYNV